MNAHGLPIVGPGIDFTKVGAIHQKRTLAYLNHFVTHTTRFLNRFSCVCEEKLSDISVKIQRLEVTLNVLEAKLSSVHGLEGITAPSSAPAVTPAAPVAPSTQAASQPETPQPQEPEEPEEPAQPTMTISQSEEYGFYFKMLLRGVPELAVKNKMRMEGKNPELLDTPNAPYVSEPDDPEDDFDD